jgi:hypothetical protein
MQESVAAPRRAQGTFPLGPGQGLQWASDGYTRMFAALLLFAGSLPDGSGAGLCLVPLRAGGHVCIPLDAVCWVIMTPWRF